MANEYFKVGMFVTINDSNIGEKITIVVDQVFPYLIKGRVVKKDKHGTDIFTNQTRTINKKDCFCGWGNNKPVANIEE